MALCVLTARAQGSGDDPFAYLEDGGDARTHAFFREQAAQARAQLDAIPGRAAMLARIRTLSGAGTQVTALALAGSRVFYLKQGPGQAQPVLCVREGLAGSERVLLDPARLARGAAWAAIDWFVPAPDGRFVAYGVSLAESEDSVLRVLVVDGARDLGIEIDRTRFNAELAWHPDARSFYYARLPAGNPAARRNANIRVYRHEIGRGAAADEIVFASGVGGARDVPEIVFPHLHVPVESRYAYAVVREGARRELAVHVTEQRELAGGRPRWRKLAGVEHEVLGIEGWHDDLFVISKLKAPHHRVLRVKGSADMSAARVVVAEGDVVIQSMALAKDALYLRTMVAGVDRLERVPLGLLGAKAAEFVRIPFDNAVTQLVADPRTSGALLRLQGWIEPPAIVQVEARGGNLRSTRVQPPATVDLSAMDEVRLYAPSHDGARIPVTLLYRKATRLTGDNPTLLVAYGSYGVPFPATFDASRSAWLERGGIYAIAHVRGGGEYGDAWHAAARGALKANTIRDFIAVSEFLVSYGFTSPKRLAILGTGAGGIPAGGALVRRPDLYAAMVARVPVMDMVRFEAMASGPANVPEFGSAATAQGLEALRVMSAYHQVKDGTSYPAVLLTAGINDPRVEAWQPGKMAARLQKATTSGKPVLLRIDYEAGHGRGSTRAQRDEELADIYSFLLWQMGDPAFQPVAVAAPEPEPSIAAQPAKAAP